jgi:hypothetical protein
MQVHIKYYDADSLTQEEVVSQAHRNYGNNIKVTVSPMGSTPHDYVYFAIQQIITHTQLSHFFSDKEQYHKKMQELRTETLVKLTELLDTVIIDNEDRIGG